MQTPDPVHRMLTKRQAFILPILAGLQGLQQNSGCSAIALRDYLPIKHYALCCLYSKACSLIYVHVREIEQADELLCTGLERPY